MKAAESRPSAFMASSAWLSSCIPGIINEFTLGSLSGWLAEWMDEQMIRSQSCRSQRVLALSLFMRLFAAVILFKRLPTDYLRTCYEFFVSLGLLHPHAEQRCPTIVLAKA